MTNPIKAVDYPIIVTQKDDIFTFRVRELFVVEQDSDPVAGLKRTQKRISDIIADHAANDALNDLPPPETCQEPSNEQRSLKLFAVKGAIVALILVVIMAASAATFTYAIREPLRHAGQKLGHAAIAQLEKGLMEAADKELTPERREHLRLRIAKATPYLKTYVSEFRPLIEGLCPPIR